MTTIVTRAGKGSPLTHTEVDTNFTNLNTNKFETAAIPLGTLAAPSISFVGDANTGAYSPGADTLAFVTAGSNRVHITSAGLVGIGTTSVDAAAKAAISKGGAEGLEFQVGNTAGVCEILAYNRSSSAYTEFRHDAATHQWKIGGTERARIDSSGRLLVGTSSARSNVYVGAGATTPQTQFELNTNSYTGLSLLSYSASGYEPILNLGISLSNTAGTNTAIVNNSTLATVNFVGNDGTNFRSAAWIQAQVDGTPGANDMPGRLVFSTTADGGSSPSPRMTINSGGNVLIGKLTENIGTAGVEIGVNGGGYISVTRTSDTPLFVNRNTNDGTLVQFDQGGVTEGTISVSGTTVSYNGAHLSRWSQFPAGAERTEILRGSVLSNIDEMCEWIDPPTETVLWAEGDELPEGVSVGDVKEQAKSGGPQANEQLNRMKVSVVEGDKNVSGVFQCWDDDDDTYINDFYCAMTGDFIIRIAEGVTVERGDLLMSAGDGTAKPQDDDIIRSKTIAKVTSTNVSCTYDDGSYCVPCVLMAC